MDQLGGGANSTVEITLNGKPRLVPADTSVSDLIATLNLHERLVVVERNAEIVARSGFSSTTLLSGDILEIVHFVGGG